MLSRISYSAASIIIGLNMLFVSIFIGFVSGIRESTLAVIIPATFVFVLSVFCYLINSSKIQDKLPKLPTNLVFKFTLILQFVIALYISFSPYLFRFAITPTIFSVLFGSGLLTLFVLLFTDISRLSSI